MDEINRSPSVPRLVERLCSFTSNNAINIQKNVYRHFHRRITHNKLKKGVNIYTSVNTFLCVIFSQENTRNVYIYIYIYIYISTHTHKYEIFENVYIFLERNMYSELKSLCVYKYRDI